MHVDLASAVVTPFVLVTGLMSLAAAVSIWRVRNGGILTRAFVGQLVVWCIWGLFISAETLFHGDWRNIDRMILSVPQFIILFWVLPSIRKGKQ